MPSHPTDAGNRSAIMAQVNILKHLGHEVHYLFVSTELSHSIDYNAMRNYWEKDKLHIFTMCTLLKAKRVFIDIIRKRFNHHYWKVDDHYPWGIVHYINRLNQNEHFDACIIQYYRLSRLLPQISIQRKAIFTHDVFSYKNIRVDGTFYETLNAHEEAKAMQRCPNIFAIQQDEATYFKMLSPKSSVYTVYNPYQIHPQKLNNVKTLLFLASRMSFNTIGIQWFLEHVWPILCKRVHEIELYIGGTVCEKIENNYDNVHLLGRVDNLDTFYNLGNIVINPVYQGTGLKIKTFEALSYGKATIVHPHSMTGIYNTNQAPLLSASSPKEWIDIIEPLIDDTKRIKELSQKSISYIEEMNRFIQMQYEDFLTK